MSLLFKIGNAIHVWLYRSSGGKRAGSIAGMPVCLLTTTGRKTGVERTVPIVYFTDGEDRIVVASKGGAPTHPAWYRNLEANPSVTVQVGAESYRATARPAEGDERAQLWRKIVAEGPQFAGYEKKTARVIPVIRLVRTA